LLVAFKITVKMGCSSKISTKKIACCELKQTEDRYIITQGFIYKNGIKHAEIIEANKKENEFYTSIKAEVISKNKYLNGQIIYMQMDSNFHCH
jgi:hypothetical protein